MIDHVATRMALRAAACCAAVALFGSSVARADGNLQNVNHIIVLMQENHSVVPAAPLPAPNDPGCPFT